MAYFVQDWSEFSATNVSYHEGVDNKPEYMCYPMDSECIGAVHGKHLNADIPPDMYLLDPGLAQQHLAGMGFSIAPEPNAQGETSYCLEEGMQCMAKSLSMYPDPSALPAVYGTLDVDTMPRYPGHKTLDSELECNIAAEVATAWGRMYEGSDAQTALTGRPCFLPPLLLRVTAPRQALPPNPLQLTTRS
jgi:hypothetical protein